MELREEVLQLEEQLAQYEQHIRKLKQHNQQLYEELCRVRVQPEPQPAVFIEEDMIKRFPGAGKKGPYPVRSLQARKEINGYILYSVSCPPDIVRALGWIQGDQIEIIDVGNTLCLHNTYWRQISSDNPTRMLQHIHPKVGWPSWRITIPPRVIHSLGWEKGYKIRFVLSGEDILLV